MAEQSKRYKVGADGRTPEERRTGKKWIKPTPVFGERIFIKPAGKGKKTDVSKMKEARFWMPQPFRQSKEGVVMGTGFHTVADGDRLGAVGVEFKGFSMGRSRLCSEVA